jgi:hypothetical protein
MPFWVFAEWKKSMLMAPLVSKALWYEQLLNVHNGILGKKEPVMVDIADKQVTVVDAIETTTTLASAIADWNTASLSAPK